MSDVLNRQLLTITSLVQLEKRARHAATPEELGFLLVNETHALVRYRQAILWRRGPRGGKVVALSGLSSPDANAPFMVWLSRVMERLGRDKDAKAVRALTAADLPGAEGAEWGSWLPPHLVWLPLCSPEGESLGALCLVRDEPWTEHDRHLLAYVADAYGHALAYVLGPSWRRGRAPFLSRNRIAAAVGLLLFAAAWIPVRASVLAPAEIVARDPLVVRAPIDGVVDRFSVRPNEAVTAGQLLLALDPVRLKNRLDVAAKALEVSEAEYRQAAQQALFDPRSKADLAILKGRMEQSAAEVDYLKSLLDRIEIRAPRDGIAIFDDANDWIGKPVTIGERILTVADPRQTELEIHLPVADAISLEKGAEVRLFLNVDPQNPIPAELTYTGYQAAQGPDGTVAYRLKAAFGPDTVPRIGLKGTAKVYGEETTLFQHVMRRPIAALRQRTGL